MALFILKLSLSIGLGIGITSFDYFLWLIFYGNSSYGLMAIELMILAVLLILYKKNKNGTDLETRHGFTNDSISSNFVFKSLPVVFIVLVTSSLVSFLAISSNLVHGGWDAWLIWNLLARFLYRGGENWHTAFNNLPMNHHADYPLLIPCSIARIWQLNGGETQYAPILIGLLFTIAVLGLTFSTICLIKNRNQAWLAGIVMTGATNYIVLGAYQYADVPLSYFFMATLALFFLQDLTESNNGLSVLAGIMGGLACWTKNEGLLFLLLIGIVYIFLILVKQRKKMLIRQLLTFSAGAALILTIVIYYKIAYAPANDLIHQLNMKLLLHNILDASRYYDIGKNILDTILNANPLLLFVMLYPFYSGIQKDVIHKDSTILATSTILLLFAGYYFIYVVTPYDLKWHLASSLSRLLMQIWPSIILLVFVIAEFPENCFFSVSKKYSVMNGLKDEGYD
jgi:hypothetical protein